jgi:hypothetical protein
MSFFQKLSAENLTEVLAEARKITQWYREVKKGSNILAPLMEKRAKLVGYSQLLHEEQGVYRKEYHQDYMIRKVRETQQYLTHRKAKLSIKDAEHRARNDVKEEFENEKQSEAMYSYMYNFCVNLKDTLDAMKQDIATYKKELEE